MLILVDKCCMIFVFHLVSSVLIWRCSDDIIDIIVCIYIHDFVIEIPTIFTLLTQGLSLVCTIYNSNVYVNTQYCMNEAYVYTMSITLNHTILRQLKSY